MGTLPAEVELLLREAQEHKGAERRHRRQKRLKTAELETLCEKLGIDFRRIHHHGTAKRHSQEAQGRDA